MVDSATGGLILAHRAAARDEAARKASQELIADLQAKLRESEAGAAAMRRYAILRQRLEQECYNSLPAASPYKAASSLALKLVDEALSPTAGVDMLERVAWLEREAERMKDLLVRCHADYEDQLTNGGGFSKGHCIVLVNAIVDVLK